MNRTCQAHRLSEAAGVHVVNGRDLVVKQVLGRRRDH